VRYADAAGREHREKAGTKGMAQKLYLKRKMEVLQGKKLPETIRRKQILVSDLLDAAADHVQSRYRAHRLGADKKDYRYAALKNALGNHPAEPSRRVKLNGPYQHSPTSGNGNRHLSIGIRHFSHWPFGLGLRMIRSHQTPPVLFIVAVKITGASDGFPLAKKRSSGPLSKPTTPQNCPPLIWPCTPA
jgi:hypothetical protein